MWVGGLLDVDGCFGRLCIADSDIDIYFIFNVEVLFTNTELKQLLLIANRPKKSRKCVLISGVAIVDCINSS